MSEEDSLVVPTAAANALDVTICKPGRCGWPPAESCPRWGGAMHPTRRFNVDARSATKIQQVKRAPSQRHPTRRAVDAAAPHQLSVKPEQSR
jgi:hypothetical protein